MTILILGLVAMVAFSGCAEKKSDVATVPTESNQTQEEIKNNQTQEEVVYIDEDEIEEDCDTCYPSDTEGKVPEITGTVERYGDRQYKVVLTVRNTHEDDFVYDSVRTELDNDQEEDQRDVISRIDYNKGANKHAGHVTITRGNARTITIYTESLDDLDNIKDSGEMTLRVALDLDGHEQCSLDATLPDYNKLKSRQNLLITEVRNINDN